MMDPWKLVELNNDRAWRNFELLQTARSHLMNAMFALQAGDTKADAIRILKAGLAATECAPAPNADFATPTTPRTQGDEI